MKKHIKLLVTLMAATVFSLAACDTKTERNPAVDNTNTTETPEAKTYTVRFNSNGGSTVRAAVVKENARVSKPEDPTKDGYTFDGWYKDAECTVKMDFASVVTSDLVLYAKWVEYVAPAKTFTVTFETNGGSTIVSVTVNENDRVTPPNNPTKENYSFGGWYVDAGLTQAMNFDDKIVANTTLYAKWNSLETPPVDTYYTVQFATNGGSTIVSVDVKENAKVTRPTDPTKNGYKFVGWYTDMALSTAMNFNNPITGDLTLYAKWEKVGDSNLGIVDRDVYIPKAVSFSTEAHTSTQQAIIDCGSLPSSGSFNQNFDNDGDGYFTNGIKVMKYRYNVNGDTLNLFADNTYYSNTLYHGREGAIYNVDPIGGINQISVTYTATYSSTQNKGYSFSGDEIIKPNIRFGTNPKCEDYVYFLDPTSNSATCNVNLSGYHYFSVNTGTYNLSLNTITVDYDNVSITTPAISEASGLNKKRINPTRYTYPLVAGESKITVPLETTYNEATNTYTVTKSKELTYYNLNYVRNHPECTNDAAITDPILICAYYNAFKVFPANFEVKSNMSNVRNVFGDKARQVSPYTRTDGYARAVPCHLGDKYYEFDIDLDGSYSASRGTGRVVAWETGWTGTGYNDSPVCIYTDDHYSTFIEYLNNGTWSNRFNAQGYISGIKHSPAETVSLTGFNPNMVEGTSQGGGGQGGGQQGGGDEQKLIDDNDYYANFAPVEMINETTAMFQQVTNMSGVIEGCSYLLASNTTGYVYPYLHRFTVDENRHAMQFSNSNAINDVTKFYFELVSTNTGYIYYKINNNKVYLGCDLNNPKDVTDAKTLFNLSFDAYGNFNITISNKAFRNNTTSTGKFAFYASGTQNPIQLYRFCDIEGATPFEEKYQDKEFELITDDSELIDKVDYVIVSENFKKTIFASKTVVIDPETKELKIPEDSYYNVLTFKKHESYDLYALSIGWFYYVVFDKNIGGINFTEEPTYFDVSINNGFVKLVPMSFDGGSPEPIYINNELCFLGYDEQLDDFNFITDESKLDTRLYVEIKPEPVVHIDYSLANPPSCFGLDHYLLLVCQESKKCFLDDSNAIYNINDGDLTIDGVPNYKAMHIVKHETQNIFCIQYETDDGARYVAVDLDTGEVYESDQPYWFKVSIYGNNTVEIQPAKYYSQVGEWYGIGAETEVCRLNYDPVDGRFKLCRYDAEATLYLYEVTLSIY